MNKKESYSYVVLRYVHDVVAGEFVNVGLVMLVPGREHVLKRASKKYGRIKNFFPNLDATAYKHAIDAINRGLRDVERNLKPKDLLNDNKTALSYAQRALPLDDSSLQWSPVGTGLTDDPQKTFNHLYERFVTRYDRTPQRPRTDDDVWRVVASKLKERDVNIELEPIRIVGNTDSVEFSHAWKNGRWHAYEPLSFDLADAANIKNKARRWLGHLAAVKDDAVDDVKVHFIVGRPQSESLTDAYKNALEILRRVPFETNVFEDNKIDDIVHRIEGEVSKHEPRLGGYSDDRVIDGVD